jgi:hypothetical protein
MISQKNIVDLNNGSMVKDLFSKHGGERFKLSHLHFRLMGKMFRWVKFPI